MRSTRSPSWIERLLGLAPLTAPPHVFSLDAGRLAYGRLEGTEGGAVRLAGYQAVDLPGESFQKGPLGGRFTDPQVFEDLLGRFLAGLGAVGQASLVIPDAWLRLTFTEMGKLPRDEGQRDEAIRWKLRRLVPFRVEELRVREAPVRPLPGQAEPERLLLGFALQSLLAQLEQSFERCQVRLGQITNRSLAVLQGLVDGDLDGDVLVLMLVQPEGYTLSFVRRGEPVLYRYKALAEELAEPVLGQMVCRDLKLTSSFLAEQLAGLRLGRVLVLAPAERQELWREWLSEGLGVAAEPVDPHHLPPVVTADGPPWAEIVPMLGAACLEVA